MLFMESLSFLADKYFNQNLICLIIGYAGVVIASIKGLECLQCASWIIFGLALMSVVITLVFYTIEYCTRKWYKTQNHKLDYDKKSLGGNLSECSKPKI